MGYGAVFSDDQRRVFGDDARGTARFDRALDDWNVIQDDERLAIHVDTGGRTSVHMKDSLVVAAGDVADRRLEDSYRDIGVKDDEYGRVREEAARDDGPGFTRMRVGTNQCVVSATKFLRALGGRRPLRVAPENVLWPFQGRVFGPAFPPEWIAERPPDFDPAPSPLAANRVKVAVLDTGYVAGANPDLDGVSVRTDPDPWVVGQPPTLLNWVGGHGTHVAGVLAEAAGWQVELYHFNVGSLGLDEQGGATGQPLIADTFLAAAIHEALGLGCRVINMSLGGPTALDLGLAAVSLAIRAAAGPEGTTGGRDDAVIVAAAGNEGTTQPMFPAATKGVIGVGALDDAGARAEFSNFGPWVDCAADGVDVGGPYLSGLPDPDDPSRQFAGWATWSGTSFAAPFVAGRIAAQLASGATDSARVAAAMVLAGGSPLPATMQLGVRIDGPISSTTTA